MLVYNNRKYLITNTKQRKTTDIEFEIYSRILFFLIGRSPLHLLLVRGQRQRQLLVDHLLGEHARVGGVRASLTRHNQLGDLSA
jgi:hypothetical protein